ncbi:arylamine N-acetyltransferase [Neobacillus bataviensis]|uniref:arylamine N-acetyltransferase n=1 Tax=Neobacillus bataviensis TaxID=220685 RepID=UPI00030DEA35|nr:arylamine N-acetyltransferase [Neobacillus bataviensis]
MDYIPKPIIIQFEATSCSIKQIIFHCLQLSCPCRFSRIIQIIERNEGGLCYELNPIFYFYLKENGFNAVLTDGVVYNHAADEYHQLGRTHVTILLNHEEQSYLIDTVFGGNLPLKPVPLSGETISFL